MFSSQNSPIHIHLHDISFTLIVWNWPQGMIILHHSIGKCYKLRHFYLKNWLLTIDLHRTAHIQHADIYCIQLATQDSTETRWSFCPIYLFSFSLSRRKQSQNTRMGLVLQNFISCAFIFYWSENLFNILKSLPVLLYFKRCPLTQSPALPHPNILYETQVFMCLLSWKTAFHLGHEWIPCPFNWHSGPSTEKNLLF